MILRSYRRTGQLWQSVWWAGQLTHSGTAGATMATFEEVRESSPSWGARSNGSASLFARDQLNAANESSTPKGPVDTYSAFDLT